MFALLIALLSPPALAQQDDLRAREAEILMEVEARNPELHAELLRLRDEDPHAYRERMMRLSRRMELEQNRDEMANDPVLSELHAELDVLEAEMRQLLLQYERADERDRKKLRGSIEAKAGEIYDVRTAIQGRKLDLMEARLVEAREEQAQRESEKDARVQEWVDERLE